MNTAQIALLSKATEQVNSNQELAFFALEAEFRANGPFHTAKKYDCLVNNSGEEFAIAVMSMQNSIVPRSY